MGLSAKAARRGGAIIRPALNGCASAGGVAQQNLASTTKAANVAMAIKPKTPARRSLLRITPSRLKTKPSGVARSTVNPPRVEIGEPQPGRISSMAANAASGASEKKRPIRPRAALRSAAGSAWIKGGCSIGVSQSWTSTGLLAVGSGLRLKSTLTVTFLPIRFLGTRHEYEQVPPQPYSKLPLATALPPA